MQVKYGHNKGSVMAEHKWLPKGHSNTYSYRASLPLAEEVAARMGITSAEALYIINTVGECILRRLFKGLISGIPQIGVFYCRRKKWSGSQLPHIKRRRGYEGIFDYDRERTMIGLWSAKPLTAHLNRQCAYGPPMKEQLKQLRQVPTLGRRGKTYAKPNYKVHGGWSEANADGGYANAGSEYADRPSFEEGLGQKHGSMFAPRGGETLPRLVARKQLIAHLKKEKAAKNHRERLRDELKKREQNAG